MCVCVLILYPPCIYSREPRVRTFTTDVRDQWGDATCLVEVVGPTGQVGRPVGRSACPGHQPPPTSSGRLYWASLSDPHWGWPVLTSFGLVLGLHLVHLSLNRCSDIFCDFMSGQSVLATCILAPEYNLHFLKDKVWFRDFIE